MNNLRIRLLTCVLFTVGVLSLSMTGRAAERKLYVEDFRDRMAGAWIGQSVGVAYGWPTEFRYVGQLVPDEKMPNWKAELVNETSFHCQYNGHCVGGEIVMYFAAEVLNEAKFHHYPGGR